MGAGNVARRKRERGAVEMAVRSCNISRDALRYGGGTWRRNTADIEVLASNIYSGCRRLWRVIVAEISGLICGALK